METPEAIELLEQQKNLICHDCIHPAMVGWCENHCKLSEAFDMAVDAMKAQADGDTISRKAAIDRLKREEKILYSPAGLKYLVKAIESLPSAQPERLTDDDFETIRIHLNAYKEKLCNQHRWKEADEYQRIIDRFMAFASAQPETHEKHTETHACDLIDRQAAIDAITRKMVSIPTAGEKDLMGDVNRIRAEDISVIRRLPSAQPERTCVNCGRTVNNGGWYADGRTRCPIEEHYALPKDGFCHLWEKRNFTDDDYPERREE